MAVRKIEQEMEQLSLLREAPPDEARTGLRKALKDPVNLMVAKAAAIASGRQFRDLIPDLLRAFDRLFGDAARRDPKCWGKNAIAKALTELEHRESAAYLRGMGHIQMEAGWGGAVDTADILRGICVLGLVASTDIRREDALRALIDAARDSSEPVRVEVVRGIAQMEGEEAPLLLRLMARMRDPAAAVMGQTFDALLALEQEAALPFVAGFLRSIVKEVREEAALSLGSSHVPGTVALLREAWQDPHAGELHDVLLRALSLTRQEEAFGFLLELVRHGRLADGVAAVEALALHREMRQQVEEAAGGREDEVHRAVGRAFDAGGRPPEVN